MTDDRMALTELLQKSGDGDFLRAVAEAVLQILMEADVEGLIGAGRHERSAERLNYRNGYRDRSLDTRLGALQLRIPSCARGRISRPSWSRARPPRRRWSRARRASWNEALRPTRTYRRISTTTADANVLPLKLTFGACRRGGQ